MSMPIKQAIKILKSDLEIQKEFKALPDHIEALEMVIKKVEQEPCNDCISRQEVINAFWKLNVELRPNTIDAILNMVNDMPPVNPQTKIGHWIPVSERLPKSSGVYIITRKFNDGFECKDLTEACYFDGSTWYGDNRINHKREYIERKIIAWMPLPEPYDAESEDKE